MSSTTSTTPGVMAAVGGPSIHARDDEFPILCETCLGENPLVRMTKEHAGKACKICERPFTIYRWKPGPKARYKKTELCHTCAKLKNCCQTCILDLQFGLPLAVRDQALADHQKLTMPKSDIGRGYMIEAHEKAMELSGPLTTHHVVDPSTLQKGSMLDRLARREPFYKRNMAHLCSFFARGECNRGVLCPFRHEMPPTGEMAKQNFKDRYYGNNDPVAKKMLKRVSSSPGLLMPPDDKSITTLWLGGLDESTTEDEIRVRFYPYGELQSIRLITAKNCAFVTFQNRVAAEEAAKKLHEKLTIRGSNIKMNWGRPKGDKTNDPTNPSASSSTSTSTTSSMMSGPPGISRPSGPPPGISFPPPSAPIGQLHLPAADARQGATKLSVPTMDE